MPDVYFSVVLSGGATNQDQALSLGGPPSSFPVQEGIANNLFPDLTGREVALALTDYRCLYAFNDTDSDLLSVQLWVSEQSPDGADCNLGLASQDEVRQLSFAGEVTGGSFTVTIEDETTGAVSWDEDVEATASNLQDAIRELDGLEDVEVAATAAGVFRISFFGSAGKRRRGTSTADPANLTYPETETPPTASLITLFAGSPINAVAVLIDSATTVPPGVSFSLPTQSTPKDIGDLAPGEGFNFWVRRSVQADAAATATDGLKIKLAGDRFLS